jgi:hypothetical protein
VLALASGCSAFRKDSGGKDSNSYVAPDLDTLEEAPPIPYSEVYVPIDAHAYQKDGKKLPLSATLVLRNPNRTASLVVRKVDLFGQDGKRLHRVAEEAFELRPFASVEFLAKEDVSEASRRERQEPAVDLDADERSRSTPSHFIVQWGTTDDAQAPLVESVMVGADGKILYARPGHEIRKIPAHRPELPRSQPPRISRDDGSESVPARPVHAAALPQYELIRYDSNMGLSRKDP